MFTTNDAIVSFAQSCYNNARIHQAEYLYEVVENAVRAVSPKEPSAAYHLMTQHRSTGCFHPAMYNLHNVYFPMHNVHFDFSGPTFHESIVMQPGGFVEMLTSQILSK